MKDLDVTRKFMISGCGRDGTTLLWRVLSVHRHLNILFEPYDDHVAYSAKEMNKANGFKQPLSIYNMPIPECRKYIFMKRNPIDTTYSLCTRSLGTGACEDIYTKVLRTYERIDQFKKDHPKITEVIKYEQLCKDPTKYIKKCCTLLQVGYYKDLLENWRDVKPPEWSGLDTKYSSIAIQNCNNRYKENEEFTRRMKKYE